MKKILITSLLLLSFGKIWCTTWDEPWQDEIIKQSESLVLAKILKTTKKGQVQVQILKLIAGKAVPQKIKLSGFYLLDLCSISGGHGVHFEFGEVDSMYLFLKKKKKYQISTPSSGFARIKNGKVYATYRHSYHQALVSMELYEKSMLAIFNHYHQLTYDRSWANEFIQTHIHKPVAGFEEHEIEEFFLQHVALEMAYHLELKMDLSTIKPFIHSDNFHAQTSGIRSLWQNNDQETHEFIIEFIADSTKEGFSRVIGLQLLEHHDARTYKDQLLELHDQIGDAFSGFGGNIMDPRVCTNFPSQVNYALEALIEKWEE